MLPTETALLYNFSGTDAGRKLKAVLIKMRIKIKSVTPEQYLEPVGFLAGIKGIPADGRVHDGAGFSDRMLVLRGFTGNRLDLLLSELRRQKLSIPLKAVVTEHNMLWDSLTLHEELLREHEAMSRNGSD